MREQVWFWQRIVSPHMAGLAEALARRGIAVTYVAEMPMSSGRAAQGWEPPALSAARLRIAPASSMPDLVDEAPPKSLHICQGLRGNGPIADVQRRLHERGLRQWAVLETIKERGPVDALLKRFIYSHIIGGASGKLAGFLAIGGDTREWLIDRGAPTERVFPFAYFLPYGRLRASEAHRPGDSHFRILFAGRLVDLKRVDLLIDAIAEINDPTIELVVVGAGPLEGDLRLRAADRLGKRVRWRGQVSMTQMPQLMAEADCLVLPSRYDGWGAVVSEAMMVGTPVICSDRCGASVAVRASGRGGVFRAGDLASLTELIGSVVAAGRPSVSDRDDLANWAECLGAEAGSEYLERILTATEGAAPPPPPWLRQTGVKTPPQQSSQVA